MPGIPSTVAPSRRPRRHALVAVSALTAAVLAAAGVPTVARAAGSTAEWSYSGRTGPQYWGSLDPAYAACSDGSAQSPIDLSAPLVRKPLRSPGLHYVTGTALVFNNGHTVEAEANPGSTMTLDGVTYPLNQIHFHSLSEHEVAGRHFPVEVHFVHKSATGAVAVVAVLVEQGRPTNRAWQPYVHALTVPAGSEEHARIDWSAMLPKDRRNYRYTGSLTTPPCTEGVKWVVMADPVRLSAAQIAAFETAYDHNYRPVRPRNHRTVVFDISGD